LSFKMQEVKEWQLKLSKVIQVIYFN
jgi:hypothetical protein